MKTIAFDIGNVLCRTDFTRFSRLVEEFGFGDSAELLDYFQAPMDIGLCSLRNALKHLCNPIHKHHDPNTLRIMDEEWLKIIKMSEPMLQMVKGLLDDRWAVALLSNVGQEHAKYMTEQYPILNRCSKHFSCDLGVRKPSELFYQSFFRRFPAEPFSDTTPFFDDRAENVLSARSYFRSVQFSLKFFDDDQAAAAALREFLRDQSREPSWYDR